MREGSGGGSIPLDVRSMVTALQASLEKVGSLLLSTSQGRVLRTIKKGRIDGLERGMVRVILGGAMTIIKTCRCKLWRDRTGRDHMSDGTREELLLFLSAIVSIPLFTSEKMNRTYGAKILNLPRDLCSNVIGYTLEVEDKLREGLSVMPLPLTDALETVGCSLLRLLCRCRLPCTVSYTHLTLPTIYSV